MKPRPPLPAEAVEDEDLFTEHSATIGGGVVKLDANRWQSVHEGVMAKACQAKFANNKDLRDALLRTEDAVLLHNSPDEFWGLGDGHGSNKLGELLMAIREELKREKDLITRPASPLPSPKRVPEGTNRNSYQCDC